MSNYIQQTFRLGIQWVQTCDGGGLIPLPLPLQPPLGRTETKGAFTRTDALSCGAYRAVPQRTGFAVLEPTASPSSSNFAHKSIIGGLYLSLRTNHS